MSFPFGQNESFLEDEIIELSKHVDKVIIHPYYYNNGIRTARWVPDNVLYNKPVIPKNLILRIFYFVYSCLYGIPLKEFFKEFFVLKVYSERKWMKVWFLTLIDYSIAWKAKHKSFACLSNTVHYFYWGTGWAYSLLYVEQKESNRYFIRLHGGDSYLERNNGYLPLRKLVYNKSTSLITISEDLKNYLCKNYLIESNRVIVSRIGTQDYGLNKINRLNVVRIVSVSNLIPLKRVHLIIDILSLIRDQSIEWFHFGSGRLKDELLNYAENRLDDNIKFYYMGHIGKSELMLFYMNNPIDVFINVSQFEGVPVSIMEAMSFGIPVIATDVGAVKEIVNQRNGVLLDMNFDANYVKNIIYKVKFEEFYEKRIWARNHWDMYFNSKKNYSELINIFFNE